MGALVGGMYAAGHLQEVSRWLKSLTMWQVLSLADLTLSRTHLANPDRVLETLKQIVPDVRIENLPIPYCAVAADIKNQKEVLEGADYVTLSNDEDGVAEAVERILLLEEA